MFRQMKSAITDPITVEMLTMKTPCRGDVNINNRHSEIPGRGSCTESCRRPWRWWGWPPWCCWRCRWRCSSLCCDVSGWPWADCGPYFHCSLQSVCSVHSSVLLYISLANLGQVRTNLMDLQWSVREGGGQSWTGQWPLPSNWDSDQLTGEYRSILERRTAHHPPPTALHICLGDPVRRAGCESSLRTSDRTMKTEGEDGLAADTDHWYWGLADVRCNYPGCD